MNATKPQNLVQALTRPATLADFLRENPLALTPTQRGALVTARDAEDGRVDALSRQSVNVGEGNVVPNRKTLAKLVALGLGKPIGFPESPVSIEITDFGREIAELIKPYAPGPSRADVLAGIVGDVIRNYTGFEASRNDINDIVELYRLDTSIAVVPSIADFVNSAWRIASVRSQQNQAISAAVAIRETLADSDLI